MNDIKRPEPQSTVQVAGKVATDVVSGLKTQPLLLGVITLNVMGIAAAIWFLHELVVMNSERMMFLLKNCLPVKG
jgi:hypothetical protein